MRIRKVSVKSFGSMRDRSFETPGGMTVFHGPNESGKTTLMEFIRNTLVPTKKRIVYPQRAKADSGSITLEDGGRECTVRLSGKNREGEVPECLSGLDESLYRGIYAVNPEDLNDEKIIKTSEISQKLLTVPGGDGVPDAIESIDKELQRNLGRGANSSSSLSAVESRIGELDRGISELKTKADEYGQIDRRIKELEAESASYAAESERGKEAAKTYNLYRSNEGNIAELARLESELSGLGRVIPVTEQDRGRRAELQALKDAAEKALGESTQAHVRMSNGMNGVDADDVLSRSGSIKDVVSKVDGYRDRAPGGSRPAEGDVRGKKPNILTIAGILLICIGLAGALVSIYIAAVSLVGALMLVLGLRRPVASPVRVPADDGRAEYEKSVSRLMRELGLQSEGTVSDVHRLGQLLAAAEGVRQSETDLERRRTEFLAAKSNLSDFDKRFETAGGFEKASSMSKHHDDLAGRIANLRTVLSNAGIDPDVRRCPVEEPADNRQEQRSILEEIGRLKQSMEQIMSSGGLESMIDERSARKSEMEEVLRRGAVSMVALHIADKACGDMYRNVTPGVVDTANRYLGMMTSGRYSVDTDPRNTKPAIISEEGPKDIDQWSTGLRAQYMLAIKLAIARELGGGEIPVILDDVLLTFDTDRKRGAIRALSEVSEEMQVLLFTCDDQTRDMAAELGLAIVEM